jgi:putative membrane protein
MMSMMWGYGFLMLVFVTFWIILIAVAIWALIRWLGGRRMTPPGQPSYHSPEGLSALEILQQRYARGEIDHETFEQMRERLQATSAPQSADQSWAGYRAR